MKNKTKSESFKYSSCIELLNSFTEKEMNGLAYFVSCHHFNTDIFVVELLKTLQKNILHKRTFDDAAQRLVYEKIFAEKILIKNWNEKKKKILSAKLSLLTRLAERFLSIEALHENAAYRSDLLYQKLLDKRQFKLFNRHLKKDKKQLEANPQKDINYYEHRQKTEKNVLDYLHRSGKLHKEDNLQELVYQMDIHYFLDKLSYYITLLTIEGATQKTYDTSTMKATSHLLDLPQYAGHPLIQVYRTTINLMQQQSEATYRDLLNLLDNYAGQIPEKDLNGFYIVATNFCVRQIKKGLFSFEDMFDLYKVMDEKNLLIEGDFIPVNKLKNTITAACRIHHFEWAEKAIEKYHNFIRKPVRESVYHFNLGVIFFYKNDYKSALHHFVRVENVNLNYDIDSRMMMMKSHYEIDKEYDERTLQIFRSTERFFNANQSLSTVDKKAYKNFIRTLINVYRIRHRATKMTLESIKEKVNRQEVNSDKKWLEEKIAGLNPS